MELVGPNGLLNQLTKNVLETAMDAEVTEHLGYGKHAAAGRGSRNSRNGTWTKAVLTEIGPVETEVPRDRMATTYSESVRTKARRIPTPSEIVDAVGQSPAKHRGWPPVSCSCPGIFLRCLRARQGFRRCSVSRSLFEPRPGIRLCFLPARTRARARSVHCFYCRAIVAG
ncbi:transposase [Saccharopolyspora spinosporotrichia]|uniref:Mutator family transposase n=2 Tax=Saccharopolyspora erythraea TaxID=1836 RepID=A4FHK9_SACEN|nr:hypothetical protein SACE_4265 [Saccharopolyspora erythraea NRRL 2338]